MLFQRFRVHARTRNGLDQFNLSITCKGDVKIAASVAWLPEVGYLRIVRAEVFHVHEFIHAHSFRKKLLSSFNVLYDSRNFAEF